MYWNGSHTHTCARSPLYWLQLRKAVATSDMKTGHWPWTFAHALEVCNLILWVWKYCTRAQNRRQTSVTRAAAQASSMSFQGESRTELRSPKITLNQLPHHSRILYNNPLAKEPRLDQASRLMVRHGGSSHPGSRQGQADDYENLPVRVSSFLPLLPEDCWLHIHFQNSILLWQSREQSQLGRPKLTCQSHDAMFGGGHFPQKRFKSPRLWEERVPSTKAPFKIQYWWFCDGWPCQCPWHFSQTSWSWPPRVLNHKAAAPALRPVELIQGFRAWSPSEVVARLGVGGNECVLGNRPNNHNLRDKKLFLTAIASAAGFTSGEFQKQFRTLIVSFIEVKRLQVKGPKRPNCIGLKLLCREWKCCCCRKQQTNPWQETLSDFVQWRICWIAWLLDWLC